MKNLIIFSLVFLAIFACLADAQTANPKRRTKQRNRKNKSKSGNCHLKAIDVCLDKVEAVTNNRSSAALIKTPEGISKLCKVMNDNIDCNKSFMKRCSTPLHKELYDFFVDGIVKSMAQFCQPGPIQKSFLQHSPCIHDKVLQKNDYKTKCVDNYLATLDKTSSLSNIDDRLETTCCAYNRWEECSYALVLKECGPDAKKSMQFFISKAAGDTANTLCSDAAFNFKSQKCRKLYAPQGTKPRKNTNNPISKYITSYLSFLF